MLNFVIILGDIHIKYTSLPMSTSHSLTSSSPEVNRSLKEALYETLNGILSPHHGIRVAAEERIKALEVTEGKISPPF